MKNTNQMWRLDLLEAKFESLPPRFAHTKKLIFATKRNTKLSKKLPETKEAASAEIFELKSQLFENKYHSGYKKLYRAIKKVTAHKTTVPKIFSDEEVLKQLITSRLVKSIGSSILVSKDLKTNPPKYIKSIIREIIIDKSNPNNPSQFFIANCRDSKEVNNFCSNLWNSKQIKPILNDIEWSFKMVRGNLSKNDIEERDLQTRKNLNGPRSEEEREHEQEGSDSDEGDSFDKYAEYDHLVLGSDQEDEEDDVLQSDVNYNEVTDEEPSEDESLEVDDEESDSETSSIDEPPKKKGKAEISNETVYNLPELASGYYSGGSDDEDEEDVDNDKVVRELTQPRKNRRGQRARQKIWAKKYGKEAKHILKHHERIKSEREIRQKEFEERERKRELKAKMLEEKQKPTGANTEPLGERKSTVTRTVHVEEKQIHPSWEAKKQAEAKMKNTKFQGKKITFE
ncbi:BUD22 [Candida oxycetoniae]|uniref:BUD22 n=1 Tax=Candida oxycetoniae TaxID=497107 RepID=A0AAI9SXD0_9ASCO|nr:BUD22 [Candida oxycetoniae]KAI3404846.2 BUD22 [Candida oxycetoniae]